MGEPYYRAYCKHCDSTVKTAESSTFMDAFFLPERCPGCHRFHSRHSYSWETGRLYNVEYGYWKFISADPQPPRKWYWPFGKVGQRVWTLWDGPR